MYVGHGDEKTSELAAWVTNKKDAWHLIQGPWMLQIRNSLMNG